uniref:Disks large homolog 5 N-terminal domain-containing protein n=1 Tax=Mus spicilegus TaxID=10103 RepID=A0A8C6MZW7_MUSSI
MWLHLQASSSDPVLSKKQFKKEEEKLTTEVQLITQKRNEQRDHLISLTEGSMNKRYRLNPHYEQLKLKEKEVLSFLHNLEVENIEARENIQENLHSWLMMEKNLIKKMPVLLKQESKEVQIDWALIQKCLVAMNLNGKEEQEQTSNLETQQLQTPARAEISTAQKESLLQNEFPPQEPPAELHPQHPQFFFDESSSTQFISSVCFPSWCYNCTR